MDKQEGNEPPALLVAGCIPEACCLPSKRPDAKQDKEDWENESKADSVQEGSDDRITNERVPHMAGA